MTKAVILAGGLGTRISEETIVKPKPMVEIGGMPIIWHIMKTYSHFGIKDFVICLGYKGYVIKEFFVNYWQHTSDITVGLKENKITMHKSATEDWNVTLIDTGATAMTGARLRKIKDYVKDDECFCLTYGDGVSNVNISEQIKYHKSHNKVATLTAVKSPSRFGVLNFNQDKSGKIDSFKEKPEESRDWINGGYFVLSPKVFDYLPEGDDLVFEQQPLQNITKDGELMSFKHNGFWQAMDSLRDKTQLEEICQNSKVLPWLDFS